MHDTSYALMAKLRSEVAPGSRVLDVGGADVNGSYRPLFDDCAYTSLDFKNADILVTGHEWPIEDGSFDAVISGQTLEHDPLFWVTVQNMERVLRPGGPLILIVPSAGPVHRHPVDCWRFYPDSIDAMARWAGLDVVAKSWNHDSPWHDLGAVLRKPAAKGTA